MVVSAALLVVLITQIDLNSTLATLAEARWIGWWTGLALYIMGVFIRAGRWRILVRALGMQASFSALASLYFVGTFFNIVLPTGIGGDVVRAAELARQTRRTGESFGTVVTDRFLGIIVLLAIGIIALLLAGSSVEWKLTLAVAAIFIAGSVGFWLLRRRALMLRLSHAIPNSLRDRVKEPLKALYHGLQLYHVRTLAFAALVSLVFNVVWIGINVLLGWSLGIEARLHHYLMFVPLVSLSLLLPSIGGLGVREMTYVGLFGLVGVPVEKAFALGILVYAISIVTGLIGGLAYLFQGAREYRPTRR